MDEFGDWNLTESIDTGILSSDEMDLPASNTDHIDLDEYPWAGRSLGEMENTPPVASQTSGKLYSLFQL